MEGEAVEAAQKSITSTSLIDTQHGVSFDDCELMLFISPLCSLLRAARSGRRCRSLFLGIDGLDTHLRCSRAQLARHRFWRCLIAAVVIGSVTMLDAVTHLAAVAAEGNQLFAFAVVFVTPWEKADITFDYFYLNKYPIKLFAAK